MATTTKPRSAQTVRDLLLSMAVVGAFVAFLFLIVLRPTPDPVRVVDVTSAVAVAKISDAFPVSVPVGLPSGWRATSARFTPGPTPDTGNWFNGYVNPEGQFVAVAQQDYSIPDFIKDQTQGGTEDGTVVIAGQEWVRYVNSAKGERALVRTTPELTTVVVGTVSYEELAAFAGTLQTA